MNVRHIVRNLTAILLTFGLATSAFAQGSGNSEGSGSGDSGSSKAAKPRQKFTLKLPEKYRSKDVDNDNQIGMYEWPKSDWAKFKELDLNGDGFLTAKELTQEGKGNSEKRVASSDRRGDRRDNRTRRPGSSPSSASRTGDDKPATSESSASTEPSSPPTALAASDVENQAANFFKTTDKDENGKISEDEVKKSILVRVKFEKAGIKPDYPLNQVEFVRLWVQAASATAK
jgi:hypothetical protein